MKNLARNVFLLVGLFGATAAFGAVPPLKVIVSDAGGKAAFKGSTDKSGAFTTPKVKPGIYVVQFSSSSAITGNYSIVVSAGVKKVSAAGIAGEKFGKGGVALKVDVQNLLNIVGQVASESQGALSKNGKKLVWIPPMLGSNLPGRWVEEGSAEEIASRTRGNIDRKKIQDMQNKGIGMPGS